MKAALSALMVVSLGFNSKIFAQVNVPGPATIVYKTKKDYRRLVPVMLSDDKTRIVFYPAPQDVKADDLLMPTKLKKGYLLDNIGVGKNVAFLNMTYEKYAALKEAPSSEELYKMIVDKDPLFELYDCGLKTKYEDPKKEINNMIRKKKLKNNCKEIK